MRLTSVELSRFKAFEHASFEITPFTVVIGPNNADNSSVLHALAILTQSVRVGQVVPSGTAIDLGSDVTALTHSSGTEHSPQESWSVKLRWQAPVEENDAIDPGQHIEVELLAQAPAESHGLQTTASVFMPVPPDRTIAVSAAFPVSAQASLDIDSRQAPEQSSTAIRYSANLQASPWSFHLMSVRQQADLEAIRRGDPDAMADYGWATAGPYLLTMDHAIQAFRYVGPDRFVDRSVFALGSEPVENPRSADQVIDTLVYNRDVLRRVSRRCERVFEYGIDVELIPNRQVSLVAVGSDDQRHNIVNLGSGLVQFIWVVLQLELALQRQTSSGANHVATVGIDEPELHLHPAIQPDIARV